MNRVAACDMPPRLCQDVLSQSAFLAPSAPYAISSTINCHGNVVVSSSEYLWYYSYLCLPLVMTNFWIEFYVCCRISLKETSLPTKDISNNCSRRRRRNRIHRIVATAYHLRQVEEEEEEEEDGVEKLI